ncbi:MAG: CBS domain-containing protein [Desulfurococcaceae archaeon]
MPNFDDSIFRHISELEIISKKDVKYIYPATTILKALEEMAFSYRSLPVIQPSGVFEGLLTVMRVVNYLGGGELFEIVERRHNYDVFSALKREIVESIMEKNPVIVYTDEGIKEALNRMIMYGAGILPVLDRGGRLKGIITEHDFVKYLSGTVSIGLRVKDIMSSPVITISQSMSLKNALETMVKYGFRRLPVVDENYVVVGILTAVDIVKYFGTHELFKRASTGDIRNILLLPVSEVMVKEAAVVSPEDDLSTAVNTMLSRNISSVLVADEDGVLKGILTERDVLYSIVAPK